MPILLPSKAQTLLAAKIVAGCAFAFAAFSSGRYGCSPNIFCAWDPGYVPKVTPWSLGSALLAFAFLVSAAKDVIRVYTAPGPVRSDIETVAEETPEQMTAEAPEQAETEKQEQQETPPVDSAAQEEVTDTAEPETAPEDSKDEEKERLKVVNL